MTATHVDVPGGRLFVLDEGSGPPIALLHAGIADHRAWNDMVPLLNAAGYRTIRYDQRGVGRSTTDDVEFSRVDDLLAVLDAAGVDRVVLVGNSMGGQLAFDTAITTPDRVVAVVGVGSGLGGFDGGNTPEELAIFAEMERLENADPLDPAKPQGKPRRLDPPASDRLSELRCAVLAVAGELDMSEVAVTARHLEAHAPNARALIWPDVAHMIGMEQPERMTSAIVDFLAPLPRWS